MPRNQEGVIQRRHPDRTCLRQHRRSGTSPTDPGDAADLSTPQGKTICYKYEETWVVGKNRNDIFLPQFVYCQPPPLISSARLAQPSVA
jgi:hypothetical protein